MNRQLRAVALVGAVALLALAVGAVLRGAAMARDVAAAIEAQSLLLLAAGEARLADGDAQRAQEFAALAAAAASESQAPRVAVLQSGAESLAQEHAGDVQAAEAAARRALAGAQALSPADPLAVARLHDRLAGLLLSLGQMGEAQREAEAAIVAWELAGAAAAPAASHFRLGRLEVMQGRWLQAEQRFLLAGSLARQGMPITDRQQLIAALATLRLRLGRDAEAASLLDELEAWHALPSASPEPALAAALLRSELNLLRGDPGTALRLARDAETRIVRALGRDDPLRGEALHWQARAQLALGRPDRAAPLLARALPLLETADPPDAAAISTVLREQALIASWNNRQEQARDLAGRAIGAGDPALPPTHPDRLLAQIVEARLQRLSGDAARATQVQGPALDALRAGLPAGHPDLAWAQLELARSLVAAGRPAEADPLLREARAAWASRYGDESWQAAVPEIPLAEAIAALGHPAIAKRIRGGATRVLQKLPRQHPARREAEGRLQR